MKNYKILKNTMILPIALFSILSIMITQSNAQGPRFNKKGPGGFKDHKKHHMHMPFAPCREALKDLSEEDKEMLHKAMKSVHDNESVKQAREDMKTAVDNFKNSIIDAARDENPEAADKMEDIKTKCENSRKKYKGKHKGKYECYKNLTDEERKKIKESYKNAKNSDDAKELKDELNTLRKELGEKYKAYHELLKSKVKEENPDLAQTIEDCKKSKKKKKERKFNDDE